jgi:hypothetical protein
MTNVVQPGVGRHGSNIRLDERLAFLYDNRLADGVEFGRFLPACYPPDERAWSVHAVG